MEAEVLKIFDIQYHWGNMFCFFGNIFVSEVFQDSFVEFLQKCGKLFRTLFFGHPYLSRSIITSLDATMSLTFMLIWAPI